jgi:DNA-binding XRE family transcriptional regulator
VSKIIPTVPGSTHGTIFILKYIVNKSYKNLGILVKNIRSSSMKINLKELRLERGLSERDLAKNSKVAKATISRIESGEVSPLLETICKLCVALNVTLDQMVMLKDENIDYGPEDYTK